MEPFTEGPDYFNLIHSSPIDISSMASLSAVFFLVMARLLPIITLAPFFGSKVAPHPVKMALAISLFALFLPKVLAGMQGPLQYDMWLLLLLLKEMFVGLIIGNIISMPFFIVQNAGVIVDHQRGGASLMVNDPTIQNQSSPLGTLYNLVLIVLFFLLGGPFILIEALLNSYDVLPPDRMLDPRFFTHDAPFWKIQFGLLNHMMVLSIQLAMPALIMILMTDVFLGIANRLAPQVQITFLGMPLKSFLALLVIWVGWKAFNDQIVIEVHQYLNLVQKTIQAMGFGLE